MPQIPSASTPTEVLAGLVDRVTFHNSENGFCVLRVKARGQRDLITLELDADRPIGIVALGLFGRGEIPIAHAIEIGGDLVDDGSKARSRRFMNSCTVVSWSTPLIMRYFYSFMWRPARLSIISSIGQTSSRPRRATNRCRFVFSAQSIGPCPLRPNRPAKPPRCWQARTIAISRALTGISKWAEQRMFGSALRVAAYLLFSITTRRIIHYLSCGDRRIRLLPGYFGASVGTGKPNGLSSKPLPGANVRANLRPRVRAPIFAARPRTLTG